MGPLHSHARYRPYWPAALTLAELCALGPTEAQARGREVRRAVGGLFVPHEATREAERVMSEVVVDNTCSAPGAKTLLAVTGPNTVGKTTFVRHWALDHYRKHVGEVALAVPELPTWRPEGDMVATFIPVVWLTLESATAKSSFDVELLGALGHHVSKAPSVQRTVETAVRHGVRLVIVDDVHFLRTQHVWGRQALDHLKKLNTELGEHDISMILVGANLDGGPIFADPQIAGRLHAIRLGAFDIETKTDQKAWAALLRDFETQLQELLPGTEKGVLYRRSPGLVLRRTQGYLRDVHELVRGAAKLALDDGEWTITPEHLEQVELSERAQTTEASLVKHQKKRRNPKSAG